MRRLLLWSWTGNLLLLVYLFVTVTNLFTTSTGQAALIWSIANTALTYLAEPSCGRR